MTDDLLRENKKALRLQVLETRASCGDGHSDLMIDQVKAAQAKTVAAYVNFGAEPSTSKFLEWANNQGVRVLLPRIKNDTELDWHLYNPGHLAKGSLGISEPSGVSVDLNTAVLVFVPAVAVGLDGTRLGRGRGFYDRALSNVSVSVIALVHENEVFETVPHEVHDVRVAAAITCDRVLELN